MSLTASAYPASEEMNAECERIQRMLEAAQKELERLASVSARAIATYKQKYACSMVGLVDDGKYKTVQMKEAKAQTECAVEYLDYKLNEALFEAAKQAVYTWRAELSAWQSRCGNLKAEREVATVGAPATSQRPTWSRSQY